MAMLDVYSCSNPDCDCRYCVVGNGAGLSMTAYQRYHREITEDIACGKYGADAQAAMKSRDSVYLERDHAYSYCPQCDALGFGGRIAVYVHKEGKRVELHYDDLEDYCYLSGFDGLQDYTKLLEITQPCGKCGGALQFFDRLEDMKCPRCGSEMTYGRPCGARGESADFQDDDDWDIWRPTEAEEPDAGDTDDTAAELYNNEELHGDGTKTVAYYDPIKKEGWIEEYDSDGSLIIKERSNFWAKALACKGQKGTDMDCKDVEEKWESVFDAFDLSDDDSDYFCIKANKPVKEANLNVWDSNNVLLSVRGMEEKVLDFMCRITVESLAAYHECDPEDIRIGATPDGGVYSIVSACGDRMSVSEFDENHNEISHTSGFFADEEELFDSEEGF